jgi:hypothetical protein
MLRDRHRHQGRHIPHAAPPPPGLAALPPAEQQTLKELLIWSLSLMPEREQVTILRAILTPRVCRALARPQASPC